MRLISALGLLASVGTSCEVPPCSKCTSQSIDVHIVLDHSGSVKTQWPVVTDFARTFIQQVEANFQEPMFGHSRFAGTTQAYNGNIDASMSLDVQNVISRLSTRTPSGFTPTPDGLIIGGQDLIQNGRPAVNKVLVLVTDGVPRDGLCGGYWYPRNSTNRARSSSDPAGCDIFPEYASIDAANTLKAQGVLVVSVLVDKLISSSPLPFDRIDNELAHAKRTLRGVASSPPEIFAIEDVADFDLLKTQVIPELLKLMCVFVSQVRTDGCFQAGQTRDIAIAGEGFYAVSSNPKCRIRPRGGTDDSWKEFPVIFDNPLSATCRVTAESVGQWQLEISRDGGSSWTSNGAYFTAADSCETAIDQGLTEDGEINDDLFEDFDNEGEGDNYVAPSDVSSAFSVQSGAVFLLSSVVAQFMW